MSSIPTTNEHAVRAASGGKVDTKLEVVVIPVSDVDRAKRFYGSLGWRLDADFAFDNGFRVIQFTPPGSWCSVQFGTKMTSAAPGTAQGPYLIASDIEAARAELVARGVNVSEVFHPAVPGAQFQPDSAGGRLSGPAPDHASYRSFATFSDPDGNGWLIQAEMHHGAYEASAPKHHWSGWYAAYIVARERGRTSEEAAQDAALHMEAARQ